MIFKFLETQLNSRRAKDWITQVLKDIDNLELNLNLDDVKEMKKSKLKTILNKAVKEKTFERLNKLKENHSKVSHLKHYKLEMQRYLKSSKEKMKQEEAQTIFKLRSRVTDVKINSRGKYETLECEVCKEEEESQNHIMECKEIVKFRKNYKKPPNYNKLFDGNFKEQLEISKDFLENMKIKKDLSEEKKC